MDKNSGTVSTVSCTLQVLAGRPGTVGTWSIEKPVRLTDQDIDEVNCTYMQYALRNLS